MHYVEAVFPDSHKNPPFMYSPYQAQQSQKRLVEFPCLAGGTDDKASLVLAGQALWDPGTSGKAK